MSCSRDSLLRPVSLCDQRASPAVYVQLYVCTPSTQGWLGEFFFSRLHCCWSRFRGWKDHCIGGGIDFPNPRQHL